MMPIRRSAIAAMTLAVASFTPVASHAQLGVQTERNTPSAYAVINARIVPVEGPVIPRGTIVVRDGLITAIGANVAAPADARTIDGSGMSVYPGFIEAYGSLGMPAPARTAGAGGRPGAPQSPALPGGPQADAAPSSPNSLRPQGQQPELMALDLLRPTADAFSAAHAAGFTAALVAPGSGIFAGQSAVINLNAAQAREILVRSPVAMHVGFSSGRGFGGGYPSSLMGVFAVLRQAMLDAQHFGAERAAYNSNPRGMRRPGENPSLAALQPVLARQMPVVMVANSQREIERALDLALEFDFRAIIAGGQEAHLVLARLKQEEVPVLLSANFPRRPANRAADADPEPLRVLRARVNAPRSAAVLADASVTFALHSGGPDGYEHFLPNVQRAVESGLSRDAALRAMTITPAQLFGVDDRLGTLEVGKIANLTLVRGDVFERGARVSQLFVNGEPVEIRAARDSQPASSLVSGVYTVTITLDGTDRQVTLALQQNADQLRGTLQGSLGTAQIGSGTADAGGEFEFTVPLTLPAGTEEGVFSGTLVGNTLSGSVQVVGHDPGTFVGTRPNSPEARGGRPARRPPPQ